jgi:glycine reductase
LRKVLFYTNQFFGQIGGEDKAYEKPVIKDGPVGPANGFTGKLENAEIVATIICGDNYYVENMDQAKAFIKTQLDHYKVELFIAGPAFNAGRFGIACGDACVFVKKEAGIKTMTALYWENPAVEMYKREIYILEIGKSAASMKKAIEAMVPFANKLLSGAPLGTPTQEGYFAKGKRVNVFKDKNGAERAMEMLLHKLRGEPFETELELSAYDQVAPAPGILNLSKAKIALMTTGGIVPFGNPDHIPAATAKIWGKYDIADMDRLREGEFQSVHAGYDPVYANKDPNRVAPLDMMRILVSEGKIGSLYPYLISTTGNSTSVADATRMGKEMSAELLEAGVNAAVMTST